MLVMKIMFFIFLFSGFFNLYLGMRDSGEFNFIIGVFSWTFSFLICLDIWFF